MPFFCNVPRKRPEYGEPWKEFVCGWSAALISILITYPMGKVIFRQMLYGVKVRQALSQLHFEGLGYLYRGILPPLIQRTGSISLMFGVYEEIRKPLVAHDVNPFAAQLFASFMSGTAECVLTPFERIMTLLAHQKYHDRFKNTAHAFRVLRREYGIREYYRGFVPIFLRNGPSVAIFFLLKDHMRLYTAGLEESNSEWRKALRNFLSGAAIGTLTSTLLFPVNVVKIQIQSKIGGDFENVFTVMARVYNSRGRKVRNMYKGVPSNFVKAFFSWGIVNTAYEIIRDLLYPCEED